MQNGRLDGLIVLFTQIQMVNGIARVYVQRPSPRELIRLYANVAGTAFVASGLESLELGEMVAPLAVSVVPALKSGIPGMSGISALLVKCVSTGAANAFSHCAWEKSPDVVRTDFAPSPEAIRKSATAAAVQHLSRIVRENGALVVKKIWASTDARSSTAVSPKLKILPAYTRSVWQDLAVANEEEEATARTE